MNSMPRSSRVAVLLFISAVVAMSASSALAAAIAGTWSGSTGMTYVISQTGARFTWSTNTGERGEGTTDADTVQATWNAPSGAGSATGRVTQTDPSGAARRIEWSNGVVFQRAGGAVAPPATPRTFSKWSSITPDQRQFAGQPGRTSPLAVVGDAQFQAGQYMVYVAISDPDSRSVGRISRWTTHGPFSLASGDKWKATLLGSGDPLRMERNTADLLQYSSPGQGRAMIYAHNDDPAHWRAICVLPVGAGLRVNPDCFGGSGNVTFSPVTNDGAGDSGPAANPVRIFNNGNGGGVKNLPARPTTFTMMGTRRIARITTYHWNNGRGAVPGAISLRSASGQVYGPWRAAGVPAQGGGATVYWVASPNQDLPAGAYAVIDSDPTTWAWNDGSGGAGMAWIDAY